MEIDKGVNIVVGCPYTDKCTDYKQRCGACKRNERRSYYEPLPYDPPYYPVWPYWPYWPTTWYPWAITCSTTCGTFDEDQSATTQFVDAN